MIQSWAQGVRLDSQEKTLRTRALNVKYFNNLLRKHLCPILHPRRVVNISYTICEQSCGLLPCTVDSAPIYIYIDLLHRVQSSPIKHHRQGTRLLCYFSFGIWSISLDLSLLPETFGQFWFFNPGGASHSNPFLCSGWSGIQLKRKERCVRQNEIRNFGKSLEIKKCLGFKSTPLSHD